MTSPIDCAYFIGLMESPCCPAFYTNSSTVIQVISLNCFSCLSLVRNRSQPDIQAVLSCKASIVLKNLLPVKIVTKSVPIFLGVFSFYAIFYTFYSVLISLHTLFGKYNFVFNANLRFFSLL